jgi:ethanolamine ammonia-lyase small subunit
LHEKGELEFSPSERHVAELIEAIRSRTPARLLRGRVGTAYHTDTLMELREAHAAARDAVRTEIDMGKHLGSAFVEKWSFFEVCTHAKTKEEYLIRPDLGRHFNDGAQKEILSRCTPERDVHVIIGDGLSVAAVCNQAPELFTLLSEGATTRGWSIGQSFLVRHCRVGVLNEIGELLRPRVAILLIGERPGLATAESLSAYMAYRPGKGHTDANRNLISNIHGRGISVEQAAGRILDLSEQMLVQRKSGFTLREQAIINR